MLRAVTQAVQDCTPRSNTCAHAEKLLSIQQTAFAAGGPFAHLRSGLWMIDSHSLHELTELDRLGELAKRSIGRQPRKERTQPGMGIRREHGKNC